MAASAEKREVRRVVDRQAEAGAREKGIASAETVATWAEAATRETREWQLQPKKEKCVGLLIDRLNRKEYAWTDVTYVTGGFKGKRE